MDNQIRLSSRILLNVVINKVWFFFYLQENSYGTEVWIEAHLTFSWILRAQTKTEPVKIWALISFCQLLQQSVLALTVCDLWCGVVWCCCPWSPVSLWGDTIPVTVPFSFKCPYSRLSDRSVVDVLWKGVCGREGSHTHSFFVLLIFQPNMSTGATSWLFSTSQRRPRRPPFFFPSMTLQAGPYPPPPPPPPPPSLPTAPALRRTLRLHTTSTQCCWCFWSSVWCLVTCWCVWRCRGNELCKPPPTTSSSHWLCLTCCWRRWSCPGASTWRCVCVRVCFVSSTSVF